MRARQPRKVCWVRDCNKSQRARGFCDTHYRRIEAGDDLVMKPVCCIEDCGRPVKARGWCNRHHRRWLNHGDPLKVSEYAQRKRAICVVEDCGKPMHGRGYCIKHRYKVNRYGDPLAGTEKRATCVICGSRHEGLGLCSKHLYRFHKFGDPWFDGKNFPKPPSNRIQPMFVPLGLDPLLRFIAERGGLAAAIARSGPGFENGGAERDKIEKALDRAAIRGYIDLAVADHICVNGLRTHPALIWPVDYWTAERKETEETEIEEDEWEEAA